MAEAVATKCKEKKPCFLKGLCRTASCDDGQHLANGTRVRVIVPDAENKPALKDRLLKLAGAVDDLPSDMARNHDHYIHGAPKR